MFHYGYQAEQVMGKSIVKIGESSRHLDSPVEDQREVSNCANYREMEKGDYHPE
jgi:hypothetical protein